MAECHVDGCRFLACTYPGADGRCAAHGGAEAHDAVYHAWLAVHKPAKLHLIHYWQRRARRT